MNHPRLKLTQMWNGLSGVGPSASLRSGRMTNISGMLEQPFPLPVLPAVLGIRSWLGEIGVRAFEIAASAMWKLVGEIAVQVGPPRHVIARLALDCPFVGVSVRMVRRLLCHNLPWEESNCG